MSLTLSACLLFAFLPHFIDFSFFVCFLFHVLCWLTGPCVACLLSCPSLNVARQSAEPWASKSTKVTLTHLTTLMDPPPIHLQKNCLPHCSPTSTKFPVHGPNKSGIEWASSTSTGWSQDSCGWLCVQYHNMWHLYKGFIHFSLW